MRDFAKFPLPFFVISAYHKCVPCPQEGRVAIVTSVGRDAMDVGKRVRRARQAADGEGVWSWHPWAGAKSCG